MKKETLPRKHARMISPSLTLLLQAFAHKISQCLTSQTHASDISVWVEGLNRLRVCLAVCNACNFVAFTACRLDGSVGPGAKHLPDAWYHNLMVSNQTWCQAPA